MSISNDTIELVKTESDPHLRISIVLDAFDKENQTYRMELNDNEEYLAQYFEEVTEYVAAVTALLRDTAGYNLNIPDGNASRGVFVRECLKFFNKVRHEVQKNVNNIVVRNSSEKYAALFNAGFQIEFDDADLNRVQVLINELREYISSSNLFENDHQQRLLRRLEKLQSEIHKKVSDVDRLWGLVGDAGITIGKFGKEAKPFVDRIKEISEIVWRSQARAEGLPSSAEFPQLGHDRSSDEDLA